MKLRYNKHGDVYYPEYKGKGERWYFVLEKDIENSLLKRLANALTFDSEYGYAKYSVEKALYFDSEVSVMAFLGGFQSYYTNKSQEFNILEK